MTYSFAMPASPVAISANRLSPRRLPTPESSGSREASPAYLSAYPNVGVLRFVQQPGWLSPALQRLGELARLEAGWDDEDAQPPPLPLITTVREFLTSETVSSLAIQPDIVPTIRGGLLLEWHTASIDLVIEAALAGHPSFYFLDNETGEEVEAPLGQRMDAIAKAFTKLATSQ